MANENKPDLKRLHSLDALRGFDMFWIMGGGGIFIALASLTGWAPLQWWAGQLEHVPWHGFHFYDMIFPLFLFIAGISFPFMPETWTPLIEGFGVTAVGWVFLYILYKKKIFLKI